MPAKKKVPMPTTVKVLYTKYNIALTNLNEHNIELDLPLYGKVDWEKQTIYLDNGQSEDTTKETLWHEIKHIAWFLAGLPKSLYLGGTVEEEDVVSRLSTIEITLLKDNPKLLNYILS